MNQKNSTTRITRKMFKKHVHMVRDICPRTVPMQLIQITPVLSSVFCFIVLSYFLNYVVLLKQSTLNTLH